MWRRGGRREESLVDRREVLQSSLLLLGEIVGNDYNHPFFAGQSIEEIQQYVSPVIGTIASFIKELIELGAVTLMVPGNLPIGCSSSYLTLFKGSNKEEYDPETGSLTWLNKFAEYHNELLRNELNLIQQPNPHATIIYADYYNAAMQLYCSPKKFGELLVHAAEGDDHTITTLRFYVEYRHQLLE
ncbi:hypothetical protein RJ640_002638, partial [Escallonia rubra]